MTYRYALSGVSSTKLLGLLADDRLDGIHICRRRNHRVRIQTSATPGELAMLQCAIAAVLGRLGSGMAPDDVVLPRTVLLATWMLDMPGMGNTIFTCREQEDFPTRCLMDRIVVRLELLGIETFWFDVWPERHLRS